MKTVFNLITLLMLVTNVLTFAQSGRSDDKPKPIREKRSIGSFNRLTVRNGIKVYIMSGNPAQIELESDADQLQNVVTRIEGTELFVEVPDGKLLYYTHTNSRGETKRNSKPISVTLHTNELKSIRMETSCILKIDTPINTEELSVVLKTACQLTTAVSVQKLSLNLDAASQAIVNGSVTSQAELVVGGASQLIGSELTINQTTIRLSGASRAIIRVSGALSASADGVSKLTYLGNPVIKSTQATGLSSIERN